ncbi:Nrap protein [Aspergillus ambiguus]|uniref:rRNA-processing protein UTP22 n=1 Tax=Aspergillus ambiguus TaxID=176160 RepID=UPI003CCE3C20
MSAHSAKRRKISPPPSTEGVAEGHASKSFKNDRSVSGASGQQGRNSRSAELALASGFYKSSFFKLQLDELLSDSRPNYDKHISKLQDVLHKLKDAIESLPERSPQPILEADKELRSKHGITVPYPDPRPGKDTKYTVSYARPVNVNVVGSFSLRTGAKSVTPYTIDLAVTMPNSLFQEKDYVNHRYFHKRAYYIACIAAGIKETKDLNLSVKFDFQDGDSLRPIIILEPNDPATKGGKLRSQIRVITAIKDDVFPITRTLPMKSNIRQGSNDSKEDRQPTPFYNASLRSEATVGLFHKLLYSTAKNCEAFRDACVLGRTWLRQRGFGSSFQSGGFGGFEWAALMSLLFEGGGPNGKAVLLKSYSSYQLFKATMQFLAGRDLRTPLLLSAKDVAFPDGTPALYDGKRGLNVLYKMTPWSYDFLQHEASITLKMLNESRDDHFDKVFILKVNEPLLRFDRLVELPASDNANTLLALRNQRSIHEVIYKALGDRAKLIHISSQCPKPWSVDARPSRKTNTSLSVGLILNSDNTMRVVDHGPSAEEKEEAASFRTFWGQKAELRRFKDGSIRESLVWSDQPSAPSIIYQILAYILNRHFNYVEQDIKYVGDEYDEQLRICSNGVASYSSPPFQLIGDAFNSLEKSIHVMDDVPLTIRHLAPASPFLRYTALHVQNGSAVTSRPIEVVLQFESSARWPDDLTAIQMTKVAFLVKIGDSLTSAGAASTCRVGLENESSQILNNAFLDIVHESGVIFRLRIHHEREQTLLERQLKEKGANPQAKQEIAYALTAYKRLFNQSPRLTQAIRTLCTRFPLLSPTVRLVKHWFNCHLFTGYINEEFIELLVVKAFTQPFPWESPSSVMAGFLRTIHFLSRWDWQQEPLMVDVGGELTPDVIETIRTRFAAWRNIDPAMNTVAVFAASDVDPDGVTWTQYEMPPKVVAGRMSSLAKAAVKLLREKGPALEIAELFQTSLEPYDFIITLRSKVLDGRPASSTKFKNLNRNVDDPTANTTVVKSFIRDLQACFNPNILFFHGDEYCNVIAGLWHPQTTKSKTWSLKTTYSTVPSVLANSEAEHDQVSINRDAILNEISRLGTGLVDNIQG